MKCIRCGAQINAYETNCPYCGAVIEKGVRWKKKHDKATSEYEEAANARLDINMAAIYRMLKIITRVELVLFAFIFVLVCIIAAVGPVKKDIYYKLHKKQIHAEMEELYSAGEYGPIRELLSEYSLYGDTDYKEYSQITSYYYDYKSFTEEKYGVIEDVNLGNLKRSDMDILVNRIEDILNERSWDRIESDRNRDQIEIWREEVKEFCRYYMLMSDSDIEAFEAKNVDMETKDRVVEEFAQKKGFRYVES